MRHQTVIFAAAMSLIGAFVPLNAIASEAPPAVAAMEKNGIELTYLGMEGGLRGYLASKDGVQQVMYLTPDGKNMIAGLMFRDDGVNVSGVQLGRVKELSEKYAAGSKSLTLPGDPAMAKMTENPKIARLEAANGFDVGSPSAPVVYFMADPFCPYCHKAWADMKPLVKAGKLRVHVVPVSILSGSLGTAIALITAKDPAGEWMAGLGSTDGRRDGVPSSLSAEEISAARRKIAANVAVFQELKAGGTPFIAYKMGSGVMREMRGVPDDMGAFLSGLWPTLPQKTAR